MSDSVEATPTTTSASQPESRPARRFLPARRRAEASNGATRPPSPVRGRIAAGLVLGVAILLMLAIILTSAGIFIVERTLPQVDGTLTVAGLHGTVTVVRDQWGVPHIAGGDLHDTVFAQGYVTAQDRFFQMEFNRRVAAGRLAELFGSGTDDSLIKADEFLRTLGLYRAAQTEYQTIDPQTKAELQAYSDGVNAFLSTHKNSLPLEFTILGVTPQAWSPVDSLAYGRVVALSLDSTWYTKYTRALLIAKVGLTVTNDLFPPYPTNNPTLFGAYDKAAPLTASSAQPAAQPMQSAPLAVTPAQQALFSKLPLDVLEGATIVHNLLGDVQAGLGSNDWVVDGTHTTTGLPLLANDPHLGINMPSIWYEIAMRGGGLNVIGYSFPGVPGVVIGHNADIAWGVTNTGADNSDLYLETLDPKGHPGEYLFGGAWLPIQTRQETINVRGGKSVTITVRSTTHGPLLNSVVGDLASYPAVALKWTALQPGYTFAGFFQLDFARNWYEFIGALEHISISQNFVYADMGGNIGYRTSGVLPIRAGANELLPVPGATGANEWLGYVSQSRMPTLYDPPTHIIATANNQIVPTNYPVYVTNTWDQGYRARRIVDLLLAKPKLSSQDFAAIQADVYAEPSGQIDPVLIAVGQLSGGDAATAAHILSGWNGQMTRGSVAAAIYEEASGYILRDTLEPLLGKKLYGIYESNYSPAGLFSVLVSLLNAPTAPFFGATNPSDAPAARNTVVEKALNQAVSDLRARFGSDSSQWQWGLLHQATFAHPLASVTPLNLVFGVAPVQRPGDGVTVSVGGDDNFAADPPTYEQDTVSSMRQIIDMSNLDNSVWVTTTGESGQPFSNHYKDLVPLWDQNKYQQMEFSPTAVAKADVHLLIMKP